MKLSLEVLRERAEVIASEELLISINGGNQDDCHVFEELARRPNLITS
ncbi:MAG TPA: hypothetical protein VFS71_17690 [Flavobacterium sp.]|nr:hypothetical protein [Flavobacterium sp.]HEU4791525.1 hypothetical protein [Flavobacterium sp.]